MDYVLMNGRSILEFEVKFVFVIALFEPLPFKRFLNYLDCINKRIASCCYCNYLSANHYFTILECTINYLHRKYFNVRCKNVLLQKYTNKQFFVGKTNRSTLKIKSQNILHETLTAYILIDYEKKQRDYQILFSLIFQK